MEVEGEAVGGACNSPGRAEDGLIVWCRAEGWEIERSVAQPLPASAVLAPPLLPGAVPAAPPSLLAVVMAMWAAAAW